MDCFGKDKEQICDSIGKSVQKYEHLTRTVKPYPRPDKDERYTAMMHFMAIDFMKKLKAEEESSDERGFKVIEPPLVRHSSHVMDLNDLEPIYLREMHVNKVHKGKYLLCLTMADPYYFTAINLGVKDVTGDVENVRLFYYTPDVSVDPALLLPIYSILIIKEPYLTSDFTGTHGDTFIRVESPTDVLVISDMDYKEEYDKFLHPVWIVDKTPHTYESLNAEGNKHFVEKNYYQAVRCYTRALNYCAKNKSGTSRDIKKTLGNRSLANFRLERYYAAYQDALRSSEIEMDRGDEATSLNEKAYFRMGKALYCMRQYGQSAIWFTKCVELNPRNREACAELARANERIKENETGEYNVGRIIEESLAKGHLGIDAADYVNPDIEVISLGNDPNNKGVVAKTDIKRNTLLVGSKCASIAYDHEYKCRMFGSLKLDQYRIMLPNQIQNVIKLVHKVQNDPFLAKTIYQLYAGPDLDRDQPISEFIVDTERLERIITSNVFCSESSVGDNESVKSAANARNCALWAYLSFFNHSCLPNTVQHMFADFSLLYTMRDIKKGEELTLSYTGHAPYKRRMEIITSFGFKCSCRLCELDAKDPNVTARQTYALEHHEKLMDDLNTLAKQKKKPDVKVADKFAKKVREMYVDGREKELQLDMNYPLKVQAIYYACAGRFEKEAGFNIQLYELLKDYQPDAAVQALLLAVSYYRRLSDKQNEEKWLKVAEEISIGHKHMFEFLCRDNLSKR